MGPQCRVSNLGKCYSHVAFPLAFHVLSLCFPVMSISPMSHVNFKKWLYLCVEFGGRGPYESAKTLPSFWHRTSVGFPQHCHETRGMDSWMLLECVWGGGGRGSSPSHF